MSSILLTPMAAHFLAELEFSPSVSSSDIEISDFLQAERNYSNFVLRPVLVERDQPHVPSGSTLDYDRARRTMLTSFSMLESRYEIEIKKSDFPKARLLDVLDAARAFIMREAERNLILIDVDRAAIPSSRVLSIAVVESMLRSVSNIDVEHLRLTEFESGFSYAPESDMLVWQLADAIFHDDALIYGLLFFREALFSVVDVIDVHSPPESISDTALSISKKSKT